MDTWWNFGHELKKKNKWHFDNLQNAKRMNEFNISREREGGGGGNERSWQGLASGMMRWFDPLVIAHSPFTGPMENPKTPDHEMEFGGPPGALSIMIALPLVIYGLFFFCTGQYCISPSNISQVLQHLPSSLDEVFSLKALLVVVVWMLFLIVLERLLPGKIVDGMALRDKTKLQYKLNGHLTFWVSLVVVALLQYCGIISLSYCYKNYVQLATAAMLVSYLLSAGLYAASFRPQAMLALGGNTGNHVYDFYIGRELNPRIFNFDLKEFCELRPGLIGWMLLNFGMLTAQYERTGAVSAPMLLVNLFQGLDHAAPPRPSLP